MALVTGGSRGIGAATCVALAANGVKVVVNGRDPDAIEAVVAEITAAGGTAIGACADVCRWDQIDGMRERVEADLGPVDILAPFAGGFWAYTPAHEITELLGAVLPTCDRLAVEAGYTPRAANPALSSARA